MYATLRIYEMTEEWDEFLEERLDREFIPAPEQISGFVAYYSVEGGPRLFSSVTIFEDRAGAEASNRMAAELVQRQAGRSLPDAP